MAEQTTSTIVVEAGPDSVMAVIADFDNYPEWAHGVKSATVLSKDAEGRAAEVAFVLDAAPIRDEYTLAYRWDGQRAVTWSLVEARMLKAMEGAYLLEPIEASPSPSTEWSWETPAAASESSATSPSTAAWTEVTYQLSVELMIPMIGMLKRKGEKVIIDTALKGLKHRVESTQPSR